MTIKAWYITKFTGIRANFFTFFYDEFAGYLILEFLFWIYWKPNIITVKSQVINRIINGYWAGFMSEGRGVHWDNKSRRGIK